MVSTQLTTITAGSGRSASPIGVSTMDGFEDLRPEDYSVPAWAIVQPASRREGAGRHGGEFYRNVDGQYREKLDCVILKANPSNVLWRDAGSKSPECVSNDGLTGSVYGECRRCALNRFANPELAAQMDAGEQVKACHVGGYQYVVVTCDDQQLALFRTHGKNSGPSRLFNIQMRMTKLPFYGLPVTMTTVEETNARGRFFVVKFTRHEPFDAAEIAPYRDLYQSIKGVVLKDIEPEGDEATGEDTATDPNSF